MYVSVYRKSPNKIYCRRSLAEIEQIRLSVLLYGDTLQRMKEASRNLFEKFCPTQSIKFCVQSRTPSVSCRINRDQEPILRSRVTTSALLKFTTPRLAQCVLKAIKFSNTLKKRSSLLHTTLAL
jgi:hypothetical protein